MKEKCFICGDENAELGFDLQSSYQYRICPVCGKYILPESTIKILLDETTQNKDYKSKLAQYLFYNKFGGYQFIGTEQEFIDYKIELPKLNLKEFELKLVTKEMVNNWYPKTFAERVDYILLGLSQRSKFIGQSISISINEIALLFFFSNNVGDKNWNDELKFMMRYLSKQNLIENPLQEKDFKMFFAELGVTQHIAITLSAKALEQVYNLQKSQVNNKNVFIAMSFNPAIEKIYNAIDSAIRDAKCEVVSMKRRIHNKQIVPEMLRLIKESKILVMDISEPNFGAYYEAGYAQGLGKEVIITCKSSVMKKDKFPCDDKKGVECEILKKYSKPHFDIAQKQILVWEDEADLTEQLTEWIKFLMG